MEASLNHLARNIKRGKSDLLGILLFLVIGIGGQIFMLNPIRILSPRLPMLSHQDWPRSRVAQRLQVSMDSPHSREFFIEMELPRESRDDIHSNAFIRQTTSWHDNPLALARAMQDDITIDFRNERPITESSLSEVKPESKLFCSDYGYVYSCTYLAYTAHWYTRVDMLSRGDKYLSHSEMLQIVKRVDQLLFAAPDRP